jgi:hypothetical protein
MEYTQKGYYHLLCTSLLHPESSTRVFMNIKFTPLYFLCSMSESLSPVFENISARPCPVRHNGQVLGIL